MELKQLTGDVYVLCGAVNIGLVRSPGGFIAVDTGLDKQSGKAVQQAAGELGGHLAAIVNTHAHADHFGGNAFLLGNHRVPVLAPVGEAAVIRRPDFEPEYLWGGAAPLPGLRNKFLLAAASPVDEEFVPGASISVAGVVLQTLALPGHAHGQAGVLVDGVLFAADAYFDPPVVAKHGIPYMVNLGQTRDSARLVAATAADWFVPGHGLPARDISATVDYLLQRHEHALACVLAAAGRGSTLDQLVAAACREFQLAPTAVGAYALLRTTISAYLTAAVEAGDLTAAVVDGQLRFAQQGGGDA